MTHFNDKFEEFTSTDERRRLYERESLAFDAAELISQLMEDEKVSRAELAKRIGKTKSDITQLLRGTRNMTMHTFADLAYVLGYRIEFKACPTHQLRIERTGQPVEGKKYYMYRFLDRCSVQPAYQKTPLPRVRVVSESLGA